MSLSAAPRQHLVENWQTRQMARPKNYKAQRRTTQQRRRHLAPRMACKTRHLAARLQRNRRRPRAVKIVIAMNRGTITLGVRIALIHGSVAWIPIIAAGELAPYLRAMAHLRAKDFGTGPDEPTLTYLL